jgi:hypothetical protein
VSACASSATQHAHVPLASAQRVSYLGTVADTFSTNISTILDKQREALNSRLSREIASQRAAIGEMSANLRLTLKAEPLQPMP